MSKGPVVLCILDGVGWGRRDGGDAVFMAETPNLDRLCSDHPWTLLAAHGVAVGMPSNSDMGNSEVGHNAMGAGRVFDQGAKLVQNAVDDGSIWQSPAWQQAVQGETLHLIGLVSDGNVHSHVNHLRAMVSQAAADGVGRLRVHVLTDGRDVSARSALEFIRPLEALLDDVDGDYAIGSGGGRMHITMDRYEADWPMVERGWRTHVAGDARRFPTASEAIETLYSEDSQVDDQYLPAFVVGDYTGMSDGDSVILFNFRGDRAVELCQAFDDPTFSAFERAPNPSVFFAGMMQYDGDLQIPKQFLVQPPVITDTVSENLAKAGVQTFAVSETQKFGHVTYFFNGNRGDQPDSETWAELASLNTPFEDAPHMSAEEVTSKAIEAIESGAFDHIRLNLANGDMVGHTGQLEPTISAVESVDVEVGRLMRAVQAAGGVMLITADHGDADQMYGIDKTSGSYTTSPHTSHSLNPVPVWLYDPHRARALSASPGPEVTGGIAQIGGTVLELHGLAPPGEYLPSLLRKT